MKTVITSVSYIPKLSFWVKTEWHRVYVSKPLFRCQDFIVTQNCTSFKMLGTFVHCCKLILRILIVWFVVLRPRQQLHQGSYGNEKNRTPGLFQDFSRTIPGLFSFFKDSCSFFPILYKTTWKMHFFSQRQQNEKGHSISLILTLVIKTETSAQIE